MNSCKECSENLPETTRFCPSCGARVPESAQATGVRISDEAMVSGDVIGTQHQTSVSGNYTVNNVTHEDQTKATHQCQISGRLVLFHDLRMCSRCRRSVASAFYLEDILRCTACQRSVEDGYKQEVEARFADDFKIDEREARELEAFRLQAGLSPERSEELIREVRTAILSKHGPGNRDDVIPVGPLQFTVQAARAAIVKGKAEHALKLLRPGWSAGKLYPVYRESYLLALLICDPAMLESELAQFRYENLHLDLLRVRGKLATGDLEASLQAALGDNSFHRAYHHEADWALLSVEVTLDQALHESDPELRAIYLGQAQAAFQHLFEAALPELEAAIALRFVREYLTAASQAEGSISGVIPLLVHARAELSGDATQQDVFLSAALFSYKIRALHRRERQLAALIQQPEVCVAAISAAPGSKDLPGEFVITPHGGSSYVVRITDLDGSGEIEIGRYSDGNAPGIRIRDLTKSLSRRQARLLYDDRSDLFVLVNLVAEQGNPTTVRGRQLGLEERITLNDGCDIVMGNIELRFRRRG